MIGKVECSQRNSEIVKPRKNRPGIDVTAVLSPVSHFARYCIPPEVKFHVFISLKCGEGNLFSNFIREQHEDLIKNLKIKIQSCHIHVNSNSSNMDFTLQ